MNLKLTPVLLGLLLAFLAFVIGAFVLLAALGKDTAGVTTLLVATIFPTVLAIINSAKTDQVAQKQNETAAAVERVVTQTNGTTSTLLDQVATLVDHLAAAPVTPEVRQAVDAARARLAADGRAEGRHAADTSTA